MPDSYFRAGPVPPERPTDSWPSTTTGRPDVTTIDLIAGPATAGPWSDALQHGGPPNALAVTLAEREVAMRTGRDDLAARRVAADFVGPVPVGPIEARASLVRAARSAALVDVTVSAGGRDCLRCRVWFVRVADTADLVATPDLGSLPVLPDGPGAEDFRFGYGATLEWRYEYGHAREPGPAAVWCRPTIPLLPDGAPLSPLARAALIADSASGISAELDWDVWSFVNVDLDVHVLRPVVGEWLRMEATTTLGAYGAALCRCTLSDGHGVLGAGLQTLVLAPMPS